LIEETDQHRIAPRHFRGIDQDAAGRVNDGADEDHEMSSTFAVDVSSIALNFSASDWTCLRKTINGASTSASSYSVSAKSISSCFVALPMSNGACVFTTERRPGPPFMLATYAWRSSSDAFGSPR